MSAFDWVSTVSAVIATIIGIVTLITVYIGAMQLLSQNRMYRLGLSWRSVGSWQDSLARSRLFGLQRRVSAPTVSVKRLVKTGWKPNITFPAGFTKNKGDCAEGAENVQAKASWVNFMQALGLSPADRTHYEMEDAADFVNGIVPMHWRGEDLASICSILGFQSFEDSPSAKTPMGLPMQWSGPLGWLQFQSGANGCVAEFRRRMDLRNQIDDGLHRFPWPPCPDSTEARPSFLESRLWNSINGFALHNKKTLYLGGTDKNKRPQDIEESPVLTTHDELLRYTTERARSKEEILRVLFGSKENRPKTLERESARSMRDGTDNGLGGGFPDFFNAMLRDKDKDSSKSKKEVLRPCPGLLSVVIQSELAYNRGLSINDCYEYDRKYVEEEDIDKEKYPYHLGDLYMDADLLRLMKEAVLLLQPDGFFFSPTTYLYQDITEVYQHVEKESNLRLEIFPPAFITHLKGFDQQPVSGKNERRESWRGLPRRAFSNLNNAIRPALDVALPTQPVITLTGPTKIQTLCAAMELCNNFQKMRKTARACLTVEDMKLSAKASSTLLNNLASEANDGQDMVWALLYCSDLLPRILKELADVRPGSLGMDQLSQDRVVNMNGQLRYSTLVGPDGYADYNSQLMANAQFTGLQVLAAVAYVFIAYYWIEKRWITNVAVYDTAMPQSVLMC